MLTSNPSRVLGILHAIFFSFFSGYEKMNYASAARNAQPVEYAIQRILDNSRKLISKDKNSSEREAFIAALKDVVSKLKDIQQFLETQTSNNLVPFLTSLAQSIKCCTGFLEQFDTIYSQVSLLTNEPFNIYSQVNNYQSTIESLTSEMEQFKADLSIFRVYGDCAAKFHKVVAKKLGMTWAMLSENLENERLEYGEDAWNTAVTISN